MPNKKKRGKKKIKEPAVPKPRKSFLEREITCDNKILADLRNLAAESCKKFDNFDDEVKKQKNDIDDVAAYALHEIEDELREIEMYNQQIESLEEMRFQQQQHYNSLIDEKSAEAQSTVSQLTDKVYYENTTLQIMKTVNREYNEYLDELKMYEEEKDRLEKELKEEMYEEDKKTRTEVGKNKQEMEKHLKNLFQLFNKTPTHSTQEIKTKFEKDNVNLLTEIRKLSVAYRESLKMCENSRRILRGYRLSTEIENDQVKAQHRKIQRIDQRLSTLTTLMFEYDLDTEEGATATITEDCLSTHISSEISQQEFDDNYDEEILTELRKTVIVTFPQTTQNLMDRMENIRTLIIQALNVEEPSHSTGWSVSIDPDELEEQMDVVFNRREDLLREIEKSICLIDSEDFASLNDILDFGTFEIPATKSQIEKCKRGVEKRSAMREQFIKFWRKPDDIYLKLLKKEAHLPIGGDY